MRLFYVAILLLLPGLRAPLQAQQLHIIDLHNQALRLPERRFYVQQIVDARADTSSLGQVHFGLFDRPADVAFPARPTVYLLAYLSQQLPARPTDQPLILRLTDLRIMEAITNTSETAGARCTLEWYEPLATGEYRRLGSATATTHRGGLEVTGFHAGNLVTVLRQTLKQIRLLPAPADAPVVTVAQLGQLTSTADEAATNVVYPVLAAETVNKGRYRTFHDFRNNAPDHTLPFEVETKAHTGSSLAGTYSIRPYTTDETGKQRPLPADTWGFSDGEGVYIRYQHAYFPLERHGNALTFQVYSLQPGPLIVGVGGLLGAAVGVALSAALTQTYAHHFSVDITDGSIVDNTSLVKVSGPVADSARVVLYRFEGVKAGPPATVWLNGQLVDTLRANAQLSLRLSHLTGPWQLGLRAAGAETRLNLQPDFQQANFVRCETRDGEAPRLQTVPGKEGEFALRRLATWQRVTTKRLTAK